MGNIGFYIIPAVIFGIILTGMIKKVAIFDEFLKGASEGMNSTFSIAPSLIALITATSMLKASGALDLFANIVTPFSNALGIPAQIIPLALLKPISGSGSIALLDGIFKTFPPDSYIGRLASIIMGSTETTFYTITVYFGAIGVKNLRHGVKSALVADITAIAAAIILMNIFMNKI